MPRWAGSQLKGWALLRWQGTAQPAGSEQAGQHDNTPCSSGQRSLLLLFVTGGTALQAAAAGRSKAWASKSKRTSPCVPPPHPPPPPRWAPHAQHVPPDPRPHLLLLGRLAAQVPHRVPAHVLSQQLASSRQQARVRPQLRKRVWQLALLVQQHAGGGAGRQAGALGTVSRGTRTRLAWCRTERRAQQTGTAPLGQAWLRYTPAKHSTLGAGNSWLRQPHSRCPC